MTAPTLDSPVQLQLEGFPPGVHQIDGATCRLGIAGGGIAIFDAADLELIRRYSWRVLAGHNGKLYVYSQGRKPLYMHRLIAGTPANYETDHVNGNGLDNRRTNLRTATCSQNSANSWKPKHADGRPCSSRFKGVSWRKDCKKWQACITFMGRSKALGLFWEEWEEEDAARAYDAAALENWGEFARLNFPAERVS